MPKIIVEIKKFNEDLDNKRIVRGKKESFPEQADSIKIDKVMGGFKVIRIFLKDKKAFQFCSSGSSNWSATTSMLALMAIGSQIDNKNRINAVNESVYNTIKYMIDKTNTN